MYICSKDKREFKNLHGYNIHMYYCENPDKHKSNWKGAMVGYSSLHDWVRRFLPKPDICLRCKKRNVREVANLSHQYKRDLTDWEWMCNICHRKYDGQIDRFIQWRKNNNPAPYWLGKKRSIKDKKEMSDFVKSHPNSGQFKKGVQTRLGVKLSQETKDKISQAHKRRYQLG